MKPYLLKLKFENPDVRSTDGNSWIVSGKNSTTLLTNHCATLGELESHIDRMQEELEEIRKEARSRYAAARAAPLEIEL